VRLRPPWFQRNHRSLELVAEDDVNKRYTVREKANGSRKPLYGEKTKCEVIDGDFRPFPKEQAKDAEKPAAERK